MKKSAFVAIDSEKFDCFVLKRKIASQIYENIIVEKQMIYHKNCELKLQNVTKAFLIDSKNDSKFL